MIRAVKYYGEDKQNKVACYAAARCMKCGYWNDLKLAVEVGEPGLDGPPLAIRTPASTRSFNFVCAPGCAENWRYWQGVQDAR